MGLIQSLDLSHMIHNGTGKPEPIEHLRDFVGHCYHAQIMQHVFDREEYLEAKADAEFEGVDFVWHTDHLPVTRPTYSCQDPLP
jgi:hypothetical protein